MKMRELMRKAGIMCVIVVLTTSYPVALASAVAPDDCTAPLQTEPCEAYGEANEYWYAWQLELCRDAAFDAWQSCMTGTIIMEDSVPNYNHTTAQFGCHAGYAVFELFCSARYFYHVV